MVGPRGTLGFAVICTLGLLFLGDLRLNAAPAIVVMLVWGVGVALLAHRAPPLSKHVLFAALLVRLLLLGTEPSLSDDLYRYLWEGRFALAGGNPYVEAPASPAAVALFADDPMRLRVNHPDVSTIYPPLAIWLFAVLGKLWYGPLSIQLFMGLCDALTAWALARILIRRGRSIAGAWLYALHPLAAVEAASSGHLEAAALMCLVLAIWAWERRGAHDSGAGWAALGGMVKLLPFAIVPALWRRQPLRLVLALTIGVVAALPFLSAGPDLLRGFGRYAREWSFNGGLYALLELGLGGAARPVGVLLGGLVVASAIWRFGDPARLAMWVGGAFVLLSPTVHPWYIVWAWAPALICGVRAWTVLATLMPLAYAALLSLDRSGAVWVEPVWPRLVIWPLFGLALVWEWWRQVDRPGPWGPAS